jgi:hypothetical protein
VFIYACFTHGLSHIGKIVYLKGASITFCTTGPGTGIANRTNPERNLREHEQM